MQITDVALEIQREPFARPFGFKGACFHEKWNAVVRLGDDEGHDAFGVGGLAPLWADAAVFLAHTENGGNCLMLAMLEHALQQAKGRDFADPPDMLDRILPAVHEYGKSITRNEKLRLTFTLNALVALDNAAWILHARQRGISNFQNLIPETCRKSLGHHQQSVAVVPLLTYKLSLEKIRELLDEGCFFLKVKIGQPGDEGEMLRKDMNRLTEIHEAVRDYQTPMTESDKILYYLDANGRYRKKESVLRLLEHAESIGILPQIALLEEPFAEELRFDVSDIPCRVAADESLHQAADIADRIEQGYRGIAVKPAGKTLSMAFRMVAAALERNVPCFVADNACVPVLVDWNKNVAARLPAFPGLKSGILESNGPTSYDTWPRLLGEHPCAGAQWLKPHRGAFRLDEDFYEKSGGIFADPTSYTRSFRRGA